MGNLEDRQLIRRLKRKLTKARLDQHKSQNRADRFKTALAEALADREFLRGFLDYPPPSSWPRKMVVKVEIEFEE